MNVRSMLKRDCFPSSILKTGDECRQFHPILVNGYAKITKIMNLDIYSKR